MARRGLFSPVFFIKWQRFFISKARFLSPTDSCEGDLFVCGRAEVETLMTLVSSVCELVGVLAGIPRDPC